MAIEATDLLEVICPEERYDNARGGSYRRPSTKEVIRLRRAARVLEQLGTQRVIVPKKTPDVEPEGLIKKHWVERDEFTGDPRSAMNNTGDVLAIDPTDIANE